MQPKTIVVPLESGDCTPGYGKGWRYAEWWLSMGGNTKADAPDNWAEDRANGFCDRLVKERDAAPAEEQAQ